MSATILIFALSGYLFADFLTTRDLQLGKKNLMYPFMRLLCGIVIAAIVVGIVAQLHVK